MKSPGETKRMKVHSLIDKVYGRTNLRLAWERVRANHGAGGIDRVSVKSFDLHADEYPEKALYEVHGLVNLVHLIPSLQRSL